MVIYLYAIRDTKGDVFYAPFPASSDAEAQRHVSIMMSSNPDSQINRFAPDFTLYLIGSMDTKMGSLTPTEPIHSIASLVSLKMQTPGIDLAES